jgi:molybdopterin-guanine dinucleotide biosynthesis protein A
VMTVILTGGASRRMGRDKAMLPAGSGTMLESLVRRYSRLGPVAISVNRAGRFETYGALELIDAYPGMGPLNGLYSAFSHMGEDVVFLTATDLPLGDENLALHLVGRIHGHDACVIERRSGGWEPLFAVYSRSCLPKVKECLEDGRLSFADLLREIDVLYIKESQLEGWDLDIVLMNVNTQKDYEKYLEIRRKK